MQFQRASVSSPVVRQAFVAAVPITFGYFPIGMAFGIYAVSQGLDWYWPPLIGLVQYSGAAQFFLVALLAQQTPPLLVLGSLVILNMRHIFYGLPFLDALPHGNIKRFLAIFWLTDEVYSVLTSRPKAERPPLLLVGFFAYCAWNLGCLFGGLIGERVDIPQASLGFSLTALFVILVIEQWRAHRTMVPIAVAIALWSCVTLWTNDLQIGLQLLVLMPGAMLVFVALHWAKQRRNSGGNQGD